MALSPATQLHPQQRALAELQLNTIMAREHSNSSDDDQNEEDGSVIGVSIGREQTRLTSPRTPAIEKAAALDRSGGFFESVPEESIAGILEAKSSDNISQTVQRQDFAPSSTREDVLRPPSPWRAEQRRSSQSRSLLREGLRFTRTRSSSGPNVPEKRDKTFLSGFPSFPKNLLMTGSSPNLLKEERGSGSVTPASQFDVQPRQTVHTTPPPPPPPPALPPKESEEATATATVGKLPTRPRLETLRSRPSQLRRSASETSLTPSRTLSAVPSLGDDAQWQDVHEMVNSRFKALKDSWQDSNLKLPGISNFSVANFAPDFLRERSSSQSRKGLAKESGDPMTRQPYTSSKAVVSDVTGDKVLSHPHLHQAMSHLQGDVVILGGYRGSILRSAEPPHRQVWVPVKVGLNLRKVDLEVGIGENDDERAKDKVIAGGMLTHIGPVDISRRLFKRLRTCENAQSGKLRIHDYGYDWRLHPHYLSKKLIEFLEGLPCNKAGVAKHQRGATVIAHSLGGLITRHAVNQRPELFAGVVYAGVPKTCVNILGPLRNGDDVLLSSRVLTAQVNFTIRTSFALLPLNGRCFIDKDTQEEYRVDFFDPKTWIDCRLSPCVARPLPPLPSTQPKQSGIAGYVSSLSSAWPNLPLPGRKGSGGRTKNVAEPAKATMAAGIVAEPDSMQHGSHGAETAATAGNIDTSTEGHQGREPGADHSSSVRTAVTLPREDAMEYLTRTLASVKRFKEELAFDKRHASSNSYPPVSVIYGKTVPTVIGARVKGREGIKRADAYDNLAFASGDGVVLARAAMLPDGYTAARGGVVSTDRGHVTMLGDLEAVARCLNAVLAARGRGVGLGSIDSA